MKVTRNGRNVAAAFLLFVCSTTGLAQTGDQQIRTQAFRVDGNTDHINVMGNSLPAMPQFPTLSESPALFADT